MASFCFGVNPPRAIFVIKFLNDHIDRWQTVELLVISTDNIVTAIRVVGLCWFLIISILMRVAWFNLKKYGSQVFDLVLNCSNDVFGTIVTTKKLRLVGPRIRLHKLTDHPLRWQRKVLLQTNRFSVVVVHYTEQPKRSVDYKLVIHKARSSDLIDFQWHYLSIWLLVN